jgi:hypothetical protein
MLRIHFQTNLADFLENIKGRAIAIGSRPISFLVPLPRLREIGL